MKRTFCLLAALVLFLLPVGSLADGCDHAVRATEWKLVGYVDI